MWRHIYPYNQDTQKFKCMLALVVAWFFSRSNLEYVYIYLNMNQMTLFSCMGCIMWSPSLMNTWGKLWSTCLHTIYQVQFNHKITWLIGCVQHDHVSHEHNRSLISGFPIYGEHSNCAPWTHWQTTIKYHTLSQALSLEKRHHVDV